MFFNVFAIGHSHCRMTSVRSMTHQNHYRSYPHVCPEASLAATFHASSASCLALAIRNSSSWAASSNLMASSPSSCIHDADISGERQLAAFRLGNGLGSLACIDCSQAGLVLKRLASVSPLVALGGREGGVDVRLGHLWQAKVDMVQYRDIIAISCATKWS